jgi:ABC-2 type transport system permease protein
MMWHVFRTLIIAELRMLRNQILRGPWSSKLGAAILVLLLGFGSWLLFSLLYGMASLASQPRFQNQFQRLTRELPDLTVDLRGLLETVPNLALLFALTLFVLASFSAVLSTLYLSDDLERLLVTPAAPRAIFATKLLLALAPPSLTLLLILGIGLTGFGLGMAYQPGYFIMLPLVLILLPLLPASLSALLVMLLVRIMPPQRARELIGLVSGMGTIAWFFLARTNTAVGQSSNAAGMLYGLRGIERPFLPSTWASRALSAAGNGNWNEVLLWGGIFAIVALGSFGVCVLLAERLYYSSWTRMVTDGSRVRPSSQRNLSRRNWFQQRLPSDMVAILGKDLLLFRRDLRQLQQLIVPLLFVGFSLAQLSFSRTTSSLTTTVLNDNFRVLFLLTGYIIAQTFASTLAGTGINREGRTLWQLKLAPVAAWRIVLSKFLLAYLPFLIIGILMVTIIVVGFSVSLWTLLPILLLIWLLGGGTTALRLAMTIAFPQLKWDNPQQQVSRVAGCVTPLLEISYLGLLIGAALGLPALGQLLPDWSLLLSAIGWIIALALAFGTTIGGLWFASNRLERLEV